jgi:hypothetical protein
LKRGKEREQKEKLMKCIYLLGNIHMKLRSFVYLFIHLAGVNI